MTISLYERKAYAPLTQVDASSSGFLKLYASYAGNRTDLRQSASVIACSLYEWADRSERSLNMPKLFTYEHRDPLEMRRRAMQWYGPFLSIDGAGALWRGKEEGRTGYERDRNHVAGPARDGGGAAQPRQVREEGYDR